MSNVSVIRRVAASLAAVAVLLAAGAAEAQQRKRMPVRTEPIPDTETGRPAAGSTEPNPSMMIYGPPTPVFGAPPAPPAPEPPATPAAAPVVTPIPATPAPIAVPVPPPAPAPAPLVAIPAPAPAPPPAPVATPAPPLAPAPVAIPAPVVVPPPITAPIAIQAPAPAPQPAPVAAPATRAIAAIAPAAAPRLDEKLVEQIFSCLAPGLPQDWKRTWIVVTGAGAAVAAKFYVTTSYRDEDAEEFVPCNAQEITRRITGLNAALPPAQQRWKSARLAIGSEGEYELKYDYGK